MINIILSIILFLIFLILGSFHIYWLFGGTWGLKKVIPTKSREESPLPIPKFATLIVAMVLYTFSLIYLIKSGFTDLIIPNWISNYGIWVIPIIFFIRAIGEFNYLGFFKKIKDTEFAQADSKLFSPLCLTIAIISLVLEYFK